MELIAITKFFLEMLWLKSDQFCMIYAYVLAKVICAYVLEKAGAHFMLRQ